MTKMTLHRKLLSRIDARPKDIQPKRQNAERQVTERQMAETYKIERAFGQNDV